MNPYQDPYVWSSASAAVIIISLCGLLSVAIIPFMKKWFYHTLLQFLVGLAIGSLSADGLLHLMPHAIVGSEGNHSHDEHSASLESIEKTAIWRGLTTLSGIFIFLILERLLGILTAHRKHVNKRKDETNNENINGKLVQPEKSSSNHITEGEEKQDDAQTLQTGSVPVRKGTLPLDHHVGFHGRSNFRIEHNASVAYNQDSESCVIISNHHGHSHGHSHDIPHSISAVAWMVIMGDGLHNFCDGLAIGAAFASSLTDGVSTSIAVFCHELPHELGDFAMLLKTGMTAKQALCYNGLSSVLCFMGMIIGIFLGNVHSATKWVFAFTAGMFLYIAFVDMLPELTSGNKFSQADISVLAVQFAGISCGICIMLLIALNEHSLSELLS